MKKLLYFSVSVLFILNSLVSSACTSMIISSRVTADGKPLMIKNRDTGTLDNRLEYFKGPKYSFIGLVNSPSKGGEVWAGNNTAGFCIMNTASYNIKDDNISYDDMDKEGIIMFEALGVCETVEDFEKFLEEHEKPLLVEANFGIIDAHGGAAYFEVNNFKWVKYDVNDPAVAPRGYRIQTNFSESGPREKYEGWERYITASSVMNEMWVRSNGILNIDHSDIINAFSRNYRHTLLGLDYNQNPPASGIAVDQDFIPRKSTSAVSVFEGVKPGENPLHTIMWTVLGYPSCSVAIPTIATDNDNIPEYMKNTAKKNHSPLCDFALNLKKKNVFTFSISNGSHYFVVANALKIGSTCKNIEKSINDDFYAIHKKWVSGEISDKMFFAEYKKNNRTWYDSYVARFAEND